MFYHGWDAYVQNAFPEDELRPLTCEGLSKDETDQTNIGINDVLGGYSVTLIDSLDMFPILGDQAGFEKNVERVRKYVSFNISSTVQVFETTIRGIGGLLSAHLYASVPRLGHSIEGYDGHLLELAHDLAERLLPSFETDSGIPAPRINLKYGMAGAKVTPDNDPNDVTETCTSGAGSLVLEFGLLSRLTGDYRFESAAKKAFFAIWARRSEIDLVAMAIDSKTGQWLSPMTGNGASIDSYYEYALKYHVLFGSKYFLDVYNKLHRSLVANSFDGWMFQNINFQRGNQVTYWIDSLAAFYPSVMALAGDITTAIRTHLTYYKIWNTFSALPERWNIIPIAAQDKFRPEGAINLEWYPLRPEFVESNYYIYKVTKDPLFLQIGKGVMEDLQTRNKVKCGYAGTQDVRIGSLSNRMESFFLSETTKYLYLLFDKNHQLNNEFSNFVFSTEAHPFWFDNDVMEYATAENFEGLGHIWFSGEIEDEEENLELDPDTEEHRIQNAYVSEDHARVLRELMEKQTIDPWYKKVGLPFNYGRKSRRKGNRSIVGRLIRLGVYYLRTWNSKFDVLLELFPSLANHEQSKAMTGNQKAVREKIRKKREKARAAKARASFVSDTNTFDDHSISKHTRHDSNETTIYYGENAKYFYSHQCEVWRPEKILFTSPHSIRNSKSLMESGLYSHVSTWPEFYELDRLYMFRRPKYLSEYKSLEDRNDFGLRYTLPDGICKAPEYTPPSDDSNEEKLPESVDMMFLVPKGSKRGMLISRDNDGVVEASSLNGMRIRIRRIREPPIKPGDRKTTEIEIDEQEYPECTDPQVKCEFADADICEVYGNCETFDSFEDAFDFWDWEELVDENESQQGDSVVEYNIELIDGVRIPNKLVLRNLWVSGDGAGLVNTTPDGKVKVDKYLIQNIQVVEKL